MPTGNNYRSARAVFCFALFCLGLTSAISKPAIAVAPSPPIPPTPFAQDVQPILDASFKLDPPDDADLDILFSNERIRFETDSRRTRVKYSLSRYNTRQAIDQHSTVSATWSPWLQKKPTIRVRVISLNGDVHEPPAETFVQYTRGRESRDLFTDQQTIEVPLPALERGCLVEVETTIEESQTFCSRGVSSRYSPTRATFVHDARFVLERSNDLKLRIKPYHMKFEPKKTSDETFTRYEVQYTDVAPLDIAKLESYSKDDLPIPHLRMSSGRSWEDVGQAYASLLANQEHLKSAPKVKKLVVELVPAETPKNAAIDLCLGYIREKIRYTGLEFGEQSIIPRSPDETLNSRFGDCKDQSMLLVTMLKAAGIEARIALVNTSGMGTSQDSPGLDSFDHAIVCIPGSPLPGNPRLWIDPTLPYQRATDLPASCTGDYGLVSGDAGLIWIPRAISSEHNRATRYYIDLARKGKANVKVEKIFTGLPEVKMRAAYAQVGERENKERWQKIAESEFGGQLEKLDYVDVDDLSQNFKVTAEIKNVEWGTFHENQFLIGFDPSQQLFSRLPASLWAMSEPDTNRKSDYQLSDLHEHIVEYIIRVPSGFRPQTLPDEIKETFGSLKLKSTVAMAGNNCLLSYHLSTGYGAISPAQAMRFQKFVIDRQVRNSSWSERVICQHDGQGTGNLVKTMEQVQQTPNNPAAIRKYAMALSEAGFGDIAKEYIADAIRMSPRDGSLRYTAALLYRQGRFGRDYQAGWDTVQADNLFTQAEQLLPLNQSIKFDRFDTLLHDQYGFSYSKTRVPAALRYFESIRKQMRGSDKQEAQALFQFFLAAISDGRANRLKSKTLIEFSPRLAIATMILQQGEPAAQEFAEINLGISDWKTTYKSAQLLIRGLGLSVPDPVTGDMKPSTGRTALNDGVFGNINARSTRPKRAMRSLLDFNDPHRVAVFNLYTALLLHDTKTARSLFAGGFTGHEYETTLRILSPSIANARQQQAAQAASALTARRRRFAFGSKDQTDFVRVEVSRQITDPTESLYRPLTVENKFLVATVGNKTRIYATDPAGGHWGQLAWDWLENGNPDKARESLQNHSLDDKTNSAMNTYFSTTTKAELKQEGFLRILSAILLSETKRPNRMSLAWLENNAPTEPNPIRQQCLYQALLTSYIQRGDSRAVPLAKKLYEKDPTQLTETRLYLEALLKARKFDTLEDVITEVQKTQFAALTDEYSGWLRLKNGEYESAVMLLSESNGPVKPESIRTWVSHLSKPLADLPPVNTSNTFGVEDVDFMRGQVRKGVATSDTMLAIAFRHAKSDPDTARHWLQRTVDDLVDTQKLEPQINLVMGRMAETLKLDAIATRYYRAVKETNVRSAPFETIAKAGLVRLGKTESQKSGSQKSESPQGIEQLATQPESIRRF